MTNRLFYELMYEKYIFNCMPQTKVRSNNNAYKVTVHRNCYQLLSSSV